MDKYKDIIEYIIKSLNQSFTDSSTNLDSEIDYLIRNINDSIKIATSELNVYTQKTLEITENNKLANDDYIEQISNNDVNHTRSLNKLTTDSKIDTEIETERINNLINTAGNKINSIKEQVLYNNSSTNPLIYNHMLKRDRKLREYDIHLANIDKKYNNLADTFTEANENNNNQTISSANKFMFRYNKANDTIIETMNNKVSNLDEQIKENNKLLEKLRMEHDSKLLPLETQFNNNVIKLDKDLELNRNLNKNQYELEKNELEQQINQSKTTANTKRNNSFKEFIASIDTLNTKIDLMNSNMTKHLDFYNKQYELDIQKENQAINDKLEIIKNSNDKNEISKLKKEIKQHKFNKFKLTTTLNKKTAFIKNKAKHKIDLLQSQKAIYERIKNNDAEKINAIESIEINNLENRIEVLKYNYDFETERLKRESDYKITVLRADYEKQKLDLNSEYRIEQNKINIVKNENQYKKNVNIDEIEMTKKLEEQNVNHNEHELDLELEKNNIETLLEIERNKTLFEFNKYKINSLIKKEHILFEYEQNKCFYERDKKNDLLTESISRTHIDLEYNNDLSRLITQKIEGLKEYKTKLINNEYNNANSLIKANNTYIQFNNRKDLIIAEFDLVSRVIDSFMTPLHRLVSTILSSSKILSNPTERQNFKNIVEKTIELLYGACVEFITIARRNVTSIINDQINYETGAKYASLFKSAEDQYQSNISIINEKRANITSTINNYNNTTKQFYINISNLENEKLENKRKLDKLLISKTEYKRKNNFIKNEIDRIENLIDKNNKQIEIFNKDLNAIPKQQAKYQYNLMNTKTRLTQEQKEEASILYDALKAFDEFFNIITNKLKNTIEQSKSTSLEADKFIEDISSLKSKYFKNRNSSLDFYDEVIKELTINVDAKYQKLLKQNMYANDENIKSIERDYEKFNNRMDEKNQELSDDYSEKVKKSEEKCASIVNKYNKLFEENEKTFSNENEKIDRHTSNHEDNTYKLILSFDLNIHSNIDNHLAKNTYIKKRNESDNKNLVKTYVNRRKDITDSYNEELRELNYNYILIPNQCNFKKKEIENSFKEYNLEYNKIKRDYEYELDKYNKDMKHQAYKTTSPIHSQIIKYNSILSKSRKKFNKMKRL